ncbi:MAG: formate dehydrogenase accessory sulfurtransferase FdhD [Chloroflexi bacterium]|nr:formate dehydrogenase accessory sulfurtransferase FdhD [Chloroflexota bacterium]
MLTDAAPPRPGSSARGRVWRVEGNHAVERTDVLATEEPLEIRILAGGERRTLAVTMRTPGADFELAAGFLHGEGLLADAHELLRISYCVDREVDPEQRYNIVNVELRARQLPDLASLERHFFTSSACGVCGKASLDALRVRGCAVQPGGARLTAALIGALPDRLRAAQSVFESTGGLHAAALFSPSGELLLVREDVGRHNAVDKLVGWALLQGRLPLADEIVLVSGRSSYEILQKCLAAGVGVVCSVSAPSTLAVALAQEFGITLVGFLRGDRFNVYATPERFADPTLG